MAETSSRPSGAVSPCPGGADIPRAKRGLLSTARPADAVRCNCIVKRYPDGSARILVADKAMWRIPGWEPVNASIEKKRRGHTLAEDIPVYMHMDEEQLYELAERGGKVDEHRVFQSLQRSKRRAKAAVRDLAFSNDFRWFVTLTLSPEKVNRYDPKEVTRHLNHWLDNNVRRRGLKYVLVAEHHRDGAIHFHGFFNDVFDAVDSGHSDKLGHKIYNLPAWGWGFSTAIELYGDKHHAVGYVVKYITKAEEKVGGRWYYSGGALDRPIVDYCNADFDAIRGKDAYTFPLADTGATCAVVDVDAAGTLAGEGGRPDAPTPPPVMPDYRPLIPANVAGDGGRGAAGWRVPRPPAGRGERQPEEPRPPAPAAPDGGGMPMPPGENMGEEYQQLTLWGE